MNILDMTKKDFHSLPYCTDRKQLFDSVVLIPTSEVHNSGFKCFKFIGVVKEEAICVIGKGSDVLHIDGIGGRDVSGNFQEFVKRRSWRIDILPCGYLRLFCYGSKIVIDEIVLSDFEVWAV